GHWCYKRILSGTPETLQRYRLEEPCHGVRPRPARPSTRVTTSWARSARRSTRVTASRSSSAGGLDRGPAFVLVDWEFHDCWLAARKGGLHGIADLVGVRHIVARAPE